MMAADDEFYKMLDLLKFWGKDAPGKLPQTTKMEQSTKALAKTSDDLLTGGMFQAALKGDNEELLKQALINAALYGGPGLVGKGASKAAPILGPKAIRFANRWIANLEEFLYPTKTITDIRKSARDLMKKLNIQKGEFLPDIARIENKIADMPGSGLAGWGGPDFRKSNLAASKLPKTWAEIKKAQKATDRAEVFAWTDYYTGKHLPIAQATISRLAEKLNNMNQPQKK